MKTYLSDDRTPPSSQIGAALNSLAKTILERRSCMGKRAIPYRLAYRRCSDKLLKKLVEKHMKLRLQAKDIQALSGRDHTSEEYNANLDHFRYEAGDVVYHLLVLLERNGIDLEEFAAELNSRMTEEEIARRGGVVLLKPEHVNRGNH